MLVLGFEVDKPSKFFIKTSNVAEYIEWNIQNIEAPIIDDPIIYYICKNIQGFLEGFLEAIQVSSL